MRKIRWAVAFAVLAILTAAPIADALAQERDYFQPMWRGYRLDHCYYIYNATRGPSCGIGPAQAFCRAMGHATATFWDGETSPQRITTIHIGNGNLCTTLGGTCRAYRVIRCAGGAAAAPPPGPRVGAFEFGVDRPGGDIWSGNMVGNQEECHRWCTRDLRCRSFTWVRPGIQGPSARCWIKNTVPAPVANGCCVSGVVR